VAKQPQNRNNFDILQQALDLGALMQRKPTVDLPPKA
jgi:hypothetical protein